MKKLLRIFKTCCVATATLSFASCSSVKAAVYEPGTPVKIGLICLHDEQSTYDKNFIDAMKSAATELGERVSGDPIIKTGIAETNDCFKAAKDLVKQGCNVIFADSFGHEEFMLKAAKQWPSVTFCHATGTKAKISNQANFHNAFASIYEGRYLAGYAAGLKLSRMITNGELEAKNYDTDGNVKLGYVGAFPYAEVVSGYTSWFLGVREVVSNVKMSVTFTSSWYDFNAEKSAAMSLADLGCALISQHADSMGAPGACEELGIPNVTYNIPLGTECPNTYVAYSKIDWAPYYKAVVNALFEDRAIEGEVSNNYTGTLATGSVKWACANEEDASIIDTIQDELENGDRKVFDTSKWTVNGEHLTEYLADVDDYGDFRPETNAIKTVDGITFFAESELRSAPYFDIAIDGITKLN